MEELSLSDEEEAAEPVESRVGVLQQFEEGRKALNTSLKLLDELLSKSQEDAVAKAATGSQAGSNIVTFGENNSGFQTGAIYGTVSGLTFGRK